MASRTRGIIMASFLKLLEERPVNRISVKDIVEDCGINRNTFYYHFTDIPALVEEIIKAEVDGIAHTVLHLGSIEECVEAAIQHCKIHKKAIWHLYNSASREIYESHLMDICNHIVTIYIDSLPNSRRLSPEDHEAIIQGCKCEIYGFITDWLMCGMSDDKERSFLRLCTLRHGQIEAVLARAIDG